MATWGSETPEPIKLKFGMIVYVQHTTPHAKIDSCHMGYRSSRGEIATSRTFLFLVPRARLQSTPCNMVGCPIYQKTCVCSKYIPAVSFRSKGLLPSPIYTPKTAFWDHLKLKPMDSVFTFFLATDKAIITKPDQNVKQVKYYIMI